MRNIPSPWRRMAVALLTGFLMSGCVYETTPRGMVAVPAGEFTMGTDLRDEGNHALSVGLVRPWFADERPEHRVYTKSFFIDKYEVTNRQYYIFCQATGHKPPRMWGSEKYPEGEDELPVTGVTYFDASAYAQWAGKRLPSEAEWEKAARGELGSIYPWGDRFDPEAANVSTSKKITAGHHLKPVGSYPQGKSPYGAEDMIGNAWEWVWEYYQPYPGSDDKGNADYDKKLVVVRGLSFLGVGHFPKKDYMKVVALKARAAYREKLNPLARQKDLGFRCAKDRPSLFERLKGKNEAG